MKKTTFLPFGLFASLLAVIGTAIWFSSFTSPASAQGSDDQLHAEADQGFVLYEKNGQVSCRPAESKIERQLLSPAGTQNLRVIYDNRAEAFAPEQQQTGLRIILRSTAQLEGFPLAKAAFIRAAQRWESLIMNPITIVVDVDFGPQRFGVTYPAGVLGSAGSQFLSSPTLYPALRNQLIQSAANGAEASLYNALSQNELLTDIGSTAAAGAASSLLRALGVIQPVANPEAEKTTYGDPPSIGFNSAFDYDFNPDDDIDLFKKDFDAVVVHELGHVLGFTSRVGVKEQTPSAPIQPAILDFFRFRPGVTLSTFGATQRILSSGGSQNFFDGIEPFSFSTGRPDGTGGDEQQAGHWKDDDLTGQFIGIMDPTLGFGRQQLTLNDLTAFEFMGYRLRAQEMKADDGKQEAGVIGNALLIVNRLTPLSYPSTLQRIRIYQAQGANQPNPAGAEIRLIAFNATNLGNAPPSNINLLLDVKRTLPNDFLSTVSFSSRFYEFTITNGPTINSGDWYIGFQAPTPANGVGFWLDTSGTQQQRSFFSTNNGQSFQGPLTTSETTPKPANVLIRAVVTTSATLQPCSYTISPSSQNFNANGGTGNVNVTAGQGCNWTAASNANFITINSGATGTGNGTVGFTVATNNATATRTGTLTIAGQTFTVSQAALSCSYAISPTAQNIIASGGAGTVSVTSGQGCNWTAASNANWISVTSGSSGSGNGTVNFSVAANGATASRTGTLTIAGQTFTVTQAGAIAQNPVPTLTSLTPNLIAEGSTAFTLTVTGTNFVNGATIRWNGNPRAATFVNAATLTTAIAAADVSKAGAIVVTAFNPAPGGGESSAQTLRIAGRLGNVSAASYATNVAADSIAAVFGAGLATATVVARVIPLPTELGGTTVKIKDSTGTERLAPLFFVSAGQINYLIPTGTMAGNATITITSGNGQISLGLATVTAVAPGLFTANATGKEVAAASALRVKANNAQSYESIARFDQAQNKFVTVPIDLGVATDQVFLILYGTGLRYRVSLTSAAIKIGNIDAQVLYVGSQGSLTGLDQINVLIPRSLIGRGEVDVALTLDGKPANLVRISIR